MSVDYDNYRLAIKPLIISFGRNRITKYAKSHGCNNTNVHVHNQLPVSIIVNDFRTINKIKVKKFDKLSKEQQSDWITYYNNNKILQLMTNEEHDEFHKNNEFDIKTRQWYEKQIPPKITSCKSDTIHIDNINTTDNIKDKMKSLSTPPDLNNEIDNKPKNNVTTKKKETNITATPELNNETVVNAIDSTNNISTNKKTKVRTLSIVVDNANNTTFNKNKVKSMSTPPIILQDKQTTKSSNGGNIADDETDTNNKQSSNVSVVRGNRVIRKK